MASAAEGGWFARMRNIKDARRARAVPFLLREAVRIFWAVRVPRFLANRPQSAARNTLKSASHIASDTSLMKIISGKKRCT